MKAQLFDVGEHVLLPGNIRFNDIYRCGVVLETKLEIKKKVSESLRRLPPTELNKWPELSSPLSLSSLSVPNSSTLHDQHFIYSLDEVSFPLNNSH